MVHLTIHFRVIISLIILNLGVIGLRFTFIRSTIHPKANLISFINQFLIISRTLIILEFTILLINPNFHRLIAPYLLNTNFKNLPISFMTIILLLNDFLYPNFHPLNQDRYLFKLNFSKYF